MLCSPGFAGRAPAEVYATLLGEGTYLCSERATYRILAENRAVRELRAQRSHAKIEVVARAPNEVDIYSRYAGGLDGGGAQDRRVTRLSAPSCGRVSSRVPFTGEAQRHGYRSPISRKN